MLSKALHFSFRIIGKTPRGIAYSPLRDFT
jgi:hypothetical protein